MAETIPELDAENELYRQYREKLVARCTTVPRFGHIIGRLGLKEYINLLVLIGRDL